MPTYLIKMPHSKVGYQVFENLYLYVYLHVSPAGDMHK